MKLTSLAKGALVAASLVFAAANVEARPRGGGGHGGGYHGGGYHGGGYHGGGYHGGGYHGGGYHGGGYGGRGYYGRGYGGRGYYGRGYYGGWGWGYPYLGYGWGGYSNYDYGYPGYTNADPGYGYYSDADSGLYSDPNYDYGLTSGAYQSSYPPDTSANATPSADTAVLRIRTAPDAELWFDDVETKQIGTLRTFTTPTLQPGKQYEYHLRVREMENGQPVERTRTVDVTPGKSIDVDLTPSAAQAK
jgi:uncharacterized protein (TIGR03000 family)